MPRPRLKEFHRTERRPKSDMEGSAVLTAIKLSCAGGGGTRRPKEGK